MVLANTGGSFVLIIIFMLGGFIIPREWIPKWWIWGYWFSPLQYGDTATTVNEFLAPQWDKPEKNSNIIIGAEALKNRGFYTRDYFYWIGVGALFGFVILFNCLFTLALSCLHSLGQHQAVISEEVYAEIETTDDVETKYHKHKGSMCCDNFTNKGIEKVVAIPAKQGTSLPFQPLSISFKDIKYYVDMPVEMIRQGVTDTRLQLLHGVTGSFRPGIVTALMGVSGAGKTTLMDVLAGRKTGGYIEGNIYISGYPKVQETFARISGYCEQNDIHSPQVTVYESLIYSSWLRLPAEIDWKTKLLFVKEVMQLVELDNLRDALVGLPGVSGLSTGERKRLTIAVELVSNPSIIFMDEPTSGLDARAAAIVMRTVRNTVDTGRTVVCTIHQPSIDIFESFDELLLMKRGGQVIYAGPVGRNSQKIIEYFEGIPGVPKIKDNYNPATWMLEVTSNASEQRLGVDFGDIYEGSSLFQSNKALVNDLSLPAPGTKDLDFPTQYSQPLWDQFKACMWKQNRTYWRSPGYNLVRFSFTFVSALIFGTIFWQLGSKIKKMQDLFTVMGAMYGATIFLGVNNCSTVQPVVSIERTVFYRERGARMYSAFPYAISQVIIEFPYIFSQTIIYGLIVYSMIGFEWTVSKCLWFLYIMFCTFLYYTYYGMMAVSITPNHQVAAIVASAFYAVFNLFSGFIMPRPKLPHWWVWYYWICPTAWTVNGLITSQYGDNNSEIILKNKHNSTIKEFLNSYFGFHEDFLGFVAIVLTIFPLFFAFTFAFCIRTLNFQRR
eukprot:c25899_g1_i3 orf=377-2713(+)